MSGGGAQGGGVTGHGAIRITMLYQGLNFLRPGGGKMRNAISMAAAGLALLLAGPVQAQAPLAPQTIEWRILDRIRVLDRPDLSEATSVSLPPTPDFYGSFVAAHQPGEAAARALRDRTGGLEDRIEAARTAFIQARNTFELRAPGGYSGACAWTIAGETIPARPCAVPLLVERDVRLDADNRFAVAVSDAAGRRADAAIAPTITILAGLGDSYASGEGNPDIPTDLGKVDWDAIGTNKRLNSAATASVLGKAAWTDRGCHRSAYNAQYMAAYRRAAARPQELTAFIHLSCSGASIYNGVLVPQEGLPGTGKDARFSQLQQLELIRCPSAVGTPVDLAPARGWRNKRRHKPVPPQLAPCPADRLPIHGLMLSAGGNDIGFSGVIAWALLPEGYKGTPAELGLRLLDGAVVCPAQMDEDRCRKRSSANDHIRGEGKQVGLAALYDDLQRGLDRVGIPKSSVVQSNYPNPLHSQLFVSDNKHCPLLRNDDARPLGLPRNRYGNLLVSAGNEAALGQVSMKQVGGLAGKLLNLAFSPKAAQRGFQFRIAESEAFSIETYAVAPLNGLIEAAPAGWRVAGVSDLAALRGWCATDGPAAPAARTEVDQLSLAWQATGNGRTYALRIKDPGPWRPYDPRQRLFRTPNDSYLTQWDGDSNIALLGMYHPTAELHALMSERIAAELAR